MIADTLVAVLICLSPAQPVQPDTAISISGNRFSEVFKEADRDFERNIIFLKKFVRRQSKRQKAQIKRRAMNEIK